MNEREQIEAVLATVYKPEGVKLWMEGRHKLLDNERPVDLLKAGEAERVLAVAEGLADGAYV